MNETMWKGSRDFFRSKAALSMISGSPRRRGSGVGLCWLKARGAVPNERRVLSAPAVSKPRCKCQRKTGISDILFSDGSGQVGLRKSFSGCEERIFPGCGIRRRHLPFEYQSARAKGLDGNLCRCVSQKHARSHLPNF